MFMDQIKVEPTFPPSPFSFHNQFYDKTDWLNLKQLPHHRKPVAELQLQKMHPFKTNPNYLQQHKVKLIPIDKRLRVHSFWSALGFTVWSSRYKKAPPQAMKLFFFPITHILNESSLVNQEVRVKHNNKTLAELWALGPHPSCLCSLLSVSEWLSGSLPLSFQPSPLTPQEAHSRKQYSHPRTAGKK